MKTRQGFQQVGDDSGPQYLERFYVKQTKVPQNGVLELGKKSNIIS